MKITKISLYDEPSIKEIKINHLKEFLVENFNLPVEIKKNILVRATRSIAEEIASCRIYNPKSPFDFHLPSQEEIEFELQNFEDTSKTENIIMYDGFEFQKIVTRLIENNENDLEHLHVIFTNKLMCTFDQSDYRYHGRALIGSNPSIISTTGVIEAPAKPKQYYFELISNFSQGLNVESLKKKYSGTFLEYHDDRLATVLEGYLLQAIFYYVTGEAFCDDKDCRLFNAHWQSDLLHSQIESGKLCEKHKMIMKSW